MTSLTTETILTHLISVLREGVEGPPEEFAYYSDLGPEAGLNQLLAGVDATKASQEIGGNSIAAQVHHLVFGLKVSADWLAGKRSKPDWKESWSVRAVNTEEWVALRAALAHAYRALEDIVKNHALDSEMNVGIALGNAAHIACHLGAIRQKLRVLQSGSED